MSRKPASKRAKRLGCCQSADCPSGWLGLRESDVTVLLDISEKNTRVASVRARMEELVKLFRKPKSKFYWYDFTVCGRRYRASTQETKRH
jgi:hypothetical protein